MADKDYIWVNTPVGVAGWTALARPDTNYNEKGSYQVVLRFDKNDQAVKEMLETVENFANEQFTPAQMKHKNWRLGPETDKEDDNVILWRLKSPYQPACFNIHGQEADMPRVAAGTTMTASIKLVKSRSKDWPGPKSYLNSVQIVDLVEYEGGGRKDLSDYSKGGGFTAVKQAAPEAAKDADTSAPNSDSVDDVIEDEDDPTGF